MIDSGEIAAPKTGNDINNHIHTYYSFSPYSPTKAVWMAYMSGLCTCGIMDHDSINGAEEFIQAGKIIGIPTTIGLEMRVSFKGTFLEDKRINNPDQSGVAYMAIHGVPHTAIKKTNEFMAPYREARNKRNRAMIDRINVKAAPAGIWLDFDRDVLPLSFAHDGGGVTERHLLFAFAKAITEKCGKNASVVELLENNLGMKVSAKQAAQLSDSENPFYEYDLLGILKSAFVPQIFIDATTECPKLPDMVKLCREVDAYLCYAYLGDVGDSVTGDKKAQKFEDDYLDDVFECLKEEGVKAVTYMPTRNTPAQLARLRSLCEQYNMFQISGEDINSPRQSFVCEAQRAPEFSNLYEATWALIAHEWRATKNPADGLFSKESIAKWPNLNERVKAFAEFGKEMWK
jgi:hypothetical protein